ncbi:hypothetical protein [Chryseobacterium pennipullorum]|uniref:Uncharacterized protein n=1 Tax=Chryseobacterium pennipullorum TaxID=2258963 RepID=A0A3D9AKV5_9FLAO|nr:hypothetical protein [Chryseobacterium pennipullorum]REC41993.1 hypothetical protein DRF67_20875 [Chryseobacterium pennipullorum]
MKEAKKFEFDGVDAKTEWKIGLILALPALGVFFLVMFIFEFYLPRTYFMYPVLSAAILTLVISILLLKLLSRTIKDKKWTIRVDESTLEITHKNKKHLIPLTTIRSIKNLGNVGFRYLTIITNKESIKIRVGNTGFVPFSAQKDIETIDAFIQHLSSYLQENFNKKDLKNKLNINVFPNYGVYVVKSEKIRYSIINTLKPWQIMIIFLCGGFLLLILLFTQLEKYW